MHPDLNRRPALVEEHLDALPTATATPLRTLMREYDTREALLKADFYGYVAFDEKWYDQQRTTLVQLTQGLDHQLAGVLDEHTRGQLTSLRKQVGAAGDWLLNDRLVHQLPGGNVPTTLHTFWSGRSIGADALANILAWGERARDTGWTVRVWTDEKNSDWSVKQQQKLKEYGIKLAPLSKQTIHPSLWASYDRLVHDDKPNFPAASDLARYSFLYDNGGVYVDVDIEPGAVQMSNLERYVRLPVLAPELRDLNSALGALGLPSSVKKLTADQVAEAAAIRLTKGMYNGNFIAVPAKAPALEAVITFVATALATHASKMGSRGLLESPSDAAFVTGPGPLKQALIEYLQTRCSVDAGRAVAALNQAMLHDLPLGWITAESERQEH